MTLARLSRGSAALLLAAAMFAPCGGCSNKEKVLDVETPGGQIEVERDRKTGEVDVETTDNN